MKKVFLLTFIMYSLTCCVNSKKEIFSLDKSDYVVLPFNEKTMYPIFTGVRPTQLSQKELIIIEDLFQEIIVEHNAGQARALAKHNKKNPENQYEDTGFELKTIGYKRQYVAIINKKGEKVVWVNFFCSPIGHHPFWKESRVRVLDGGNCYYNFKVNLTTKEIFDLRINGVA